MSHYNTEIATGEIGIIDHFAQQQSKPRMSLVGQNSASAPHKNEGAPRSGLGHNPNPSSTPAFPLPPATDMPPPELYSAMCHNRP